MLGSEIDQFGLSRQEGVGEGVGAVGIVGRGDGAGEGGGVTVVGVVVVGVGG